MSEKWSHFQWAFVLLPEHRRHRRRRQSAAAVQVRVALHILNKGLEKTVNYWQNREVNDLNQTLLTLLACVIGSSCALFVFLTCHKGLWV